MMDLYSPPPITFGQTLWNIVLSSKIRFSDSKSGLLYRKGAGEGKWKSNRDEGYKRVGQSQVI
jgi:hypothetical protein